MLKRKSDDGPPLDEMEDEEKQSGSSGDGGSSGSSGGSSQPVHKKQRAGAAADKPAGACTHTATSEPSLACG